MMLKTPQALLFSFLPFSLAMAGLATTSCAPALAPAMTAAPAVERAPEGAALVVFVRPGSACDTADHAVIVDEQGAFVGNAAPRSQFAAVVTPGEHVFFAWPSLDLRSQKTGWDPVGVIRMKVAPGDVVRIGVQVPEFSKLHCNRYATFIFTTRFAEGELDAWLADARPMVADKGAGQRALDAEPEVVQAHLQEGRRRLAAPPTR